MLHIYLLLCEERSYLRYTLVAATFGVVIGVTVVFVVAATFGVLIGATVVFVVADVSKVVIIVLKMC